MHATYDRYSDAPDRIRIAEPGTQRALAHKPFLMNAVFSQRLQSLVRTGVVWRQPGRVANGIEIDFTAGYGTEASDVPEPIRQALLLLVSHWYERRDPIEVGAANTMVPVPVSQLLEPYKVHSL
ncbi:MAG TPA: hypothetical protein EYP98_20125 [Planctomycetes bacterium]|nr:hypothetical protein [Planctomycetota bacterium]